MAPLLQLLTGIFSIAVIFLAAEKVVDKLERVAHYFGVSEVIIAMTLISLGTSLPEITLHVVGSFNILSEPALLNQVSGTVLGMNIGSNIVQQTLIMGSVVFLASFISGKKQMKFSRGFVLKEYLPMVGAHLLLFLLVLAGSLTRLDGLILISVFSAYMYYLYSGRHRKVVDRGDKEKSENPYLDMFVGLVAMVAVVVFSDLFLGSVESLIAVTGLSGSMIGVAVVGFVSAMPEFSTAITGLRQNAEGISLGTLIGSNITNPLLGVGIGSLISGYTVPRPLILWDLPVQITTASLLVIYLWNKETISESMENVLQYIGINRGSEKLRERENGVLTAIGGLMLVSLYLLYIGVRTAFFTADFA